MVIQSLCEITVLAQKAGMSRHAFLDFLNNSVMGSMFTRYKTPALVNLDFTVTFTPAAAAQGHRSRPRRRRASSGCRCRSTSLTRDLVQTLIGNGYGEEDFAALIKLQAKASGIELKPENVPVGDGLSS